MWCNTQPPRGCLFILLHDPTIRLKAQAAQGNAEPYAQALKELFVLEDASL